MENFIVAILRLRNFPQFAYREFNLLEFNTILLEGIVLAGELGRWHGNFKLINYFTIAIIS